MAKNKTFHKKKTLVVFLGCMLMLTVLIGRLVNLMVVQSEYYSKKADDLHERERKIKAARGRILDANGVVLADNKTVCTISVIHSQIKEPEKVIAMLTKELGIDEAQVRKRVNKISSIERVKSNVDKEVGDKIREYQFAGVKVDEDFRRFYPYGGLASRVLGFTGGDNQGIIGLEVKYEEVLKGINGTILTTTDARGIEQNGIGEKRKEPVEGFDLCISLDYNMQMYAQQEAERVMEQKEAEKVSVLLLNPQNGEIYACVNVPEFDLNDPYTLPESVTVSDRKERTDALNRMWRNTCINDTYEPGSTFKIITASAGLEAGVVTLQDQFSCPGFRVVEDRRIHCARRTGHGAQTFVQGIESVGGVDISLTEAEAAYINKFNKGGITCVAGQNHLDGRAALEYARCRKIDSDWQRVKRQRNVIQAAVNSTKDLSISELNDLMNQVFPLVQTNLSKLEITELLMLAPKCRGASIQQITIPIKDSYGGMTGLGGRSLFSVDFDTNAQALREFMYGENSDS